MKPHQILLCILSTFIVLGAVCAVFAGRSTVVRVPTLASVLGLPAATCAADSTFGAEYVVAEGSVTADSTAVAVASDTTGTPAPSDTVAAPVAAPKPVELPQSLPQTKLHLPAFYAALQTSAKRSVRIVHYGDSQIEEDRISMILRHRLQDRFGGGGIGLLPMVQTIPTYTAKQSIEQNGRELPYTFVRRYLSYGPSSMRLKGSNAYGPMAQVAQVVEPVDVQIELLRDRVPTYDYDRIRVLCSDSVTVRLVPDSLEHSRRVTGAPLNDSTPSAEPMRQEMIVLATPQRSTTLQMGGKGYVYGISLETATGVQVDNIPMRGAAGTNFTAMSRDHFASYFRNTHTALVIMQFGGNAMPSIRSRAAVEKYVESMRQQIRYLMSAAGEASLLFIGPSDMITTVEGEQMSYPMLPYLDQALAAMVTEQGGAYYSLFRLMGGAGSMFSWRDKGLAGEDMIHFTRAGAKKVGEMLAKQLLEDYNTIVESQKSIVERSSAPDSAKMIAEPQDTVTPYPNDQINRK